MKSNKKLIFIILIYLIIQIPLLFFIVPSDDNIYFYMGKEITQNKSPYTQFFYSHPPAQIYLYSLLIRLFGLKIWILKLFTILTVIGITIFLYLIAKEKFGEKVGLISVFLFLTSYDILIYGSYSFGIEMAMLPFLASLYFLNKKPFLSGLLFSLSLMIRLHLAPLGLILFIFSKKKRLFLLGSSLCLIYYAFLIRIPNFLSQVLGYHLIKERWHSGWLVFLKANIHIILLALLSLKWIRDKQFIGMTIIYLVFLIFLSSVFEYYFLPILVICCILGAVSFTKFKYKEVLYLLLLLFCLVMASKLLLFVLYETNGYNDLNDYVSSLNGSIMGVSDIASLIALKSGKNITKLQIDTNFQRNKTYNYSNSLVIHYKNLFDWQEHNCTKLRTLEAGLKEYEVFRC